jgi:hypothetical protein
MVRVEVRERWPDRELIAAIADRDGEACTVFYRRHVARIVAIRSWRLISPARCSPP